MKNKTLTYILLIVVAFIWYKVFFRVKNNLAGNNLEIVQPITSARNYSHVQRDTFDLKTNYRDPFSEVKIQPKPKDEIVKKGDLNEQRKIEKQPVDWPIIVYYGLVKKTSSNNPLAIISVDGYKHTLRRNEVLYDGLKLVDIERDQVSFIYKKEKKTITK